MPDNMIDPFDFCSLIKWKKQQKKIQDEASDKGAYDFDCQ